MPNLMPGKPGAKEAYGISKVNDDLTIIVPQKAIEHYSISDHDYVILTTGHRGKSGFGMIKKDTALKSIFKKYVNEIKKCEEIHWFNKRACVMLKINDGLIHLNKDILMAFYINIGDKLMVVKSTTVTMSFTPIEIWIYTFKKHNFYEAIENMKKLKEY